jgi:predicted dithiol-disulfide oxidoreductase (DUF899 family)
MATSQLNGLRRTRLQNESAEYLAKREELRVLELESMHVRERVAALRRTARSSSTSSCLEKNK